MMSTRVEAGSTGAQRTTGGEVLAFVDHDRQRYAAKVRLPNEGEILVGQYIEGGGTGPLGEFRIVLHDLDSRSGLLDPQLCVFGDGAAALTALLASDGVDLRGLLAPVRDHLDLSRRLAALGMRDASDLSPEECP
jgi:hypothetical protein